MTLPHDERALEPTNEQLALLRELGVEESRLEDLTYEDADELIAELRAMRQEAGRFGRNS